MNALWVNDHDCEECPVVITKLAVMLAVYMIHCQRAVLLGPATTASLVVFTCLEWDGEK